jgi:hypothetical protein
MVNDNESARSGIEAQHPIVKNAARKGIGCGVLVFIGLAVVALVIWSLSPLAPIGIAYSAVGAIPWLIGVGVLLLLVRIFTRKK